MLALVVVDESGGGRLFFYGRPWVETADTMLGAEDINLGRVA